MARKKRKSVHKQLKHQRREARVRKRKERKRKLRRAASVHRNDELIEDMLPLFPKLGDVFTPTGPAIEQLMVILAASGDMIDEPEFAEVIIDPLLCVDTLVKVAEELGIDPDSLGEPATEDQEDIRMEILEESVRRLLTDESRQDIINGLNDLRLRLKGSGRRGEAAKAATLQSFLRENESNEFWPIIGLVQAIFQRSLVVGFELIEASMEATGPDSSDRWDISVLHKFAGSSFGQKVDVLLKKVPGVRGFMEKQADRIWEEGINAIFTGELRLELFSREELKKGFDILRTEFGYDTGKETVGEESPPLKVSQETGAVFISRLDDYITDLFAPERLDKLRARLDAILREPAYTGKWLAFILMLVEYMSDQDAVENEKSFLIRALLGEMRTVSKAFSEGNDQNAD